MTQILEKTSDESSKPKELANEREIKIFTLLERDDTKAINLQKALLVSFILHPIVLFLIFSFIHILGLDKIATPILAKNNPVDIEFIFAKQPEKEPVNLKTKFRSDKNLRAGGKNNPSKKVSIKKKEKILEKVLSKDSASNNKIITPSPVPATIISQNVSTVQSTENTSLSNTINEGEKLSGDSSSSNPAPGDEKSEPGVDVVKTVDFNPYIVELQKKIKREWQPPRGEQSRKAILIFKIDKNGKLISVKVHKSSGNPASDRAALFAVERAQPFNPLPCDYNKNYVNIVFAFDSRVLNLNVSQAF